MSDSELDWLDQDLHVEGGRKELKEPKTTHLAENPGMHVHVHPKEYEPDLDHIETYEVRLRNLDHSEVRDILTIPGMDGRSKSFEILKKEVDPSLDGPTTTKFTLRELD